KIKEEVLPYVKDGSLILMHDIYGTTAQALEEILPVLKEQGYQFVTVSELYTYRHELKPVNAFS
ncbi:MAG: polysaccharide deacetylase, partial [Erysipelotrichaceae bacterium]|nr:polysaccharide deacetylase [Erysipelotrichaceae bacterium]